MAAKPLDYSQIGCDKRFQTASEAEDANNGTYKDETFDKPVESLLPLKEFPKAPDPKPYR